MKPNMTPQDEKAMRDMYNRQERERQQLQSWLDDEGRYSPLEIIVAYAVGGLLFFLIVAIGWYFFGRWQMSWFCIGLTVGIMLASAVLTIAALAALDASNNQDKEP